MNFFEIVFVFMFCCVAGWINEVIFRSIRNHRLINPGFMHGCSLPIYGCGGLIMYCICQVDVSWVESPIFKLMGIFVASAVIMTILELITGLFFLKAYHIMLWDYSKEWGNYKGIICPLFSLVWGLFSIGFYYGIYPWLAPLAMYVASQPIGLFFIGMYVGIFLVDMIVSLDVMRKIKAYAIRIHERIVLMNFKQQAQVFIEKVKKENIFSPIVKINAHMKRYLLSLEEKFNHKNKK